MGRRRGLVDCVLFSQSLGLCSSRWDVLLARGRSWSEFLLPCQRNRCSMLPIPQHGFTHFLLSSAIQEGSGFKHEMKLRCFKGGCFFFCFILASSWGRVWVSGHGVLRKLSQLCFLLSVVSSGLLLIWVFIAKPGGCLL